MSKHFSPMEAIVQRHSPSRQQSRRQQDQLSCTMMRRNSHSYCKRSDSTPVLGYEILNYRSDAERKYTLLGSWDVSNWLLRRKAFILPWANMYDRISDYPEIHKHLLEYEVLTRLSWPDWSKVNVSFGPHLC